MEGYYLNLTFLIGFILNNFPLPLIDNIGRVVLEPSLVGGTTRRKAPVMRLRFFVQS